MSFSFPENPNVDDTYSFDGKNWKWNGFAWDQYVVETNSSVLGNLLSISFETTGPGSTQPGSLAWNPDEDCLNILHTCLIHRTRKEIVVGVRKAFRLVSKGLFDVIPLINRKYRLSEIEEAFQKEKDDRGAVKTLIIP